MDGERGASRLGCLFTIFVIGVLFAASFTIGPVYLDKIAFEEDLAGIANKAGALAWSEQTIREHVVSSARGNRFDVDRHDIKISKASRFQTASRLIVTVSYAREVSIPGYSYVMHFESEAAALAGRL